MVRATSGRCWFWMFSTCPLARSAKGGRPAYIALGIKRMRFFLQRDFLFNPDLVTRWIFALRFSSGFASVCRACSHVPLIFRSAWIALLNFFDHFAAAFRCCWLCNCNCAGAILLWLDVYRTVTQAVITHSKSAQYARSEAANCCTKLDLCCEWHSRNEQNWRTGNTKISRRIRFCQSVPFRARKSRSLPFLSGLQRFVTLTWQPSFKASSSGIKSGCDTCPDCATTVTQLLGLRLWNSACAISRIVHLRLYATCRIVRLLAQRLLTDCATPRTVQLRLCNWLLALECETLQIPVPANSSKPHGTSNWHRLSTRMTWYQKFPPPWNFNLTRVRWYQNTHPNGASNWFGMSTRVRWYQNSHPHGTSNWHGASTVHKGKMISQSPSLWSFKLGSPQGWAWFAVGSREGQDDITIPTPMELQVDMACPQG